MTPEERFLKGLELSEWAKMTNKYYDKLFKKRLLEHGAYVMPELPDKSRKEKKN